MFGYRFDQVIPSVIPVLENSIAIRSDAQCIGASGTVLSRA